jgi:hypothetical protein
MKTFEYDYIVIGGGISGLVACYNLAKKNRTKILLVERLPRLGGKIYTESYKHNGQSFLMERGAARFHKGQTHVMDLLKDLCLDTDIINYPSEITCGEGLFPLLSSISLRIREGNVSKMNDLTFIEYVEKYETIDVLKRLRKYTYYETLDKGNALYIAEKLIYHYGDIQYLTLRKGLSSIVDMVTSKIHSQNNVTIQCNMNAADVKRVRGGLVVSFSNKLQYISKNVIFAVPGKYLVGFSLFEHLKCDIESIYYKTLNRIYALLPKSTKRINREKVITSNDKLNTMKIINEQPALVSYCDGDCAKKWFDITSEKNIDTMIAKELSRIEKRNVKPKKTWSYYWPNSLGLWKPGSDYTRINRKMVNPLKHVYVCGDTFSLDQCWIEGALSTTMKVVDLCGKQNKKVRKNKTRKRNTKGGSKRTTYTMSDVRKHNTRDDGWIVLYNKVYNITDWIGKHPGGIIIEEYLGKNGTSAFEASGHPDYVRKNIFPKYQIGTLVSKTKKM